jgi:hypothetical protein
LTLYQKLLPIIIDKPEFTVLVFCLKPHSEKFGIANKATKWLDFVHPHSERFWNKPTQGFWISCWDLRTQKLKLIVSGSARREKISNCEQSILNGPPTGFSEQHK